MKVLVGYSPKVSVTVAVGMGNPIAWASTLENSTNCAVLRVLSEIERRRSSVVAAVMAYVNFHFGIAALSTVATSEAVMAVTDPAMP